MRSVIGTVLLAGAVMTGVLGRAAAAVLPHACGRGEEVGVNSYDQAASAKWANLWLFLLAFHVAFIGVKLGNIERAIREARIEVRVQSGEVTP